jgi:hypothetical protein
LRDRKVGEPRPEALMIVVRVLGGVLCLVALVAGMADLSGWISSGGWRPGALGEHWFKINPYSLNLAQAVVQRYISVWLWETGIQTILLWPTWAIFGVPGLILLAIPRANPRRGRRRRK